MQIPRLHNPEALPHYFPSVWLHLVFTTMRQVGKRSERGGVRHRADDEVHLQEHRAPGGCKRIARARRGHRVKGFAVVDRTVRIQNTTRMLRTVLRTSLGWVQPLRTNTHTPIPCSGSIRHRIVWLRYTHRDADTSRNDRGPIEEKGGDN